MPHHARTRPQTTIAAGSDGVSLPTGTIHVAGALSFGIGQTIIVDTDAGPQTVTTGGRTSNTFTGCSGGTGVMHTGNIVSDPWQTILRSELAAIDAGIRSGLNGVDGGTYAPTSQVVIDGSSGGGVLVTAPTQVTHKGVLSIGGSTGLQLNDGDYPVIDQVGNTAHSSRKVVYPCSAARPAISSMWAGRREFGGALQAFAPMFDLSDGAGMRPAVARMHIRAHDGAKLTSVTVNFTVGYPHTSLPSTMPAARVYAVAPNGSFLLLTSQAAGADAFGYVYVPTPSGPTAWFSNGAPQSFTIPCDQNNLVNVGAYDYILEFVDEQGLTEWPFGLTVMQPVKVVASSTQILRGLGAGGRTIDGITVNEGDRVLCIDQVSATQNGVYNYHDRLDVYWTRVQDLSVPSQFRRGLVIPVTSGNTFAGILIQVDQSILRWSPGVAPATDTWTTGFAAPGPATYVIPSTAAKATGLVYRLSEVPSSGGGTGTSPEPQWPTVSGDVVLDADANLQWTAIGPDAMPLPMVVHPDKSFPAPIDGFIGYGLVWHSAVATYAGISDMRPQ